MSRESGDTLVEVLIATAVLAMAAVGGLGIMNFGFGAILNSIERTQVQANISSQLSLIQYSRDAFIRNGRVGTAPGGPAIWQEILAKTTTSYGSAVCSTTGAPVIASNAFYVKEDGSSPLGSVPGTTPATVAKAGNGLWVEAVRPSATTNYIDFYVKACWQPAAGSINQESRSVMRLYVP